MTDRQDPTQQESELNRLWNDIVSGETKQGAYDLPAGDAQMLSQFQQRVTRSQPDSARERAWQRTLANIEFDRLQNAQKESTLPTIATLPPSGHLHSPNGRAASRRWGEFVPEIGRAGSARRWGIAQLTIAAVLLLAGLGIGYIVFGPGFGDDEPRTTIPAAVAPVATPSPAPFTEESLLEMTIPAELLPGGEAIMSGLNHIFWYTGSVATWDASRGANNPGLRFEYVLAGSYTVEVAGPAHLLRAGTETPETVPADTPITLGPGDALVFANHVGATYEKPGGTGVELLFWILFDASKGSYSTDPIPLAWTILDLDLQTAGLSAPAGPATLRLRRIVLQDEAEFPPTASGTMQFSAGLTADNDAGTPVPARVFARSGDGSIHNFAGRATTIAVLTLEPVEGAGTPSP